MRYKTVINDIIDFFRIEILIDKNNFIPFKIKEIITHELTHALEYYKIKIKSKKLGFSVSVDPHYLSIRKSINSIQCSDQDINYLKVLIYYSLDTELNARVAQLYQALNDLNTKDQTILTNHIKMSDSYKFYSSLENFNSKSYVDHLISKLGETTTIYWYNELNNYLILNNVNKLNGYKFIKHLNNVSELYSYMLEWGNLFKYKNEKHKKRLLRIVSSVINESDSVMKKSDWVANDPIFEDRNLIYK